MDRFIKDLNLTINIKLLIGGNKHIETLEDI